MSKEKNKESKENTKLWSQLQFALLNFLNAEKSYGNLNYVGQKSASKVKICRKEFSISKYLAIYVRQDKTYELALSSMEQVDKDAIPKTQANFMEIHNFSGLIADLVNFVHLRLNMIKM